MFGQTNFRQQQEPFKRSGSITRRTSETDIELEFTIDGTGQSNIKTGVPFFDHMMDLFTKHGLFDLTLSLNGDTEIDYHHSVEDAGICLGEAFREALGNAEQINRYASQLVPMDEALCQMAIDISNRPAFVLNYDFPKTKVGNFDVELVEEFFIAFVNNARVTLHISILSGKNLHHIIEACFKAFGIVLDKATQIDPRKEGVPSTKGIL